MGWALKVGVEALGEGGDGVAQQINIMHVRPDFRCMACNVTLQVQARIGCACLCMRFAHEACTSLPIDPPPAPPALLPTTFPPCAFPCVPAVTDPAFLVTRSMEDFVTWCAPDSPARWARCDARPSQLHTLPACTRCLGVATRCCPARLRLTQDGGPCVRTGPHLLVPILNEARTHTHTSPPPPPPSPQGRHLQDQAQGAALQRQAGRL